MREKTHSVIALLMLFSLVIPWHGAMASDFAVISAQELKAKMDAGENLVLLNPLSEIEFNEGHIPGSVNIPLHQIKTTTQLPEDLNTLIVLYCLGRR